MLEMTNFSFLSNVYQGCPGNRLELENTRLCWSITMWMWSEHVFMFKPFPHKRYLQPDYFRKIIHTKTRQISINESNY